MDETRKIYNTSLKKWLNVFTSKTSRSIILAIILLIATGLFRPDHSLGLYPNEYWALKSRWKDCADIVFAGDSRVLIGLSPAEISKSLENKRIINYGFDAAWFSEGYMNAIENMLDSGSDSKTIVLAITHRALAERNESSGNFFEVGRLSQQDKFMHIYFPQVMSLFEPLSLRDAIENLSLSDTYTTHVYHENGWVSVYRNSIEVKKQLKRYREFYSSRPVSSKNISRILKYVSDWKDSGIKVIGFLFPSCEQMYELENKISGFDEKDFIHRFKEAGGYWMDVDCKGYTSFDGSHLQKESAERFSFDFGKKLSEIK